MTNRELHELLPWFMNGTLDSGEQADFAAHLTGCSSCRAEIEFLEGARRQIAEHGESLLADHPSTDALVGTVLGEVSGAEAETVRRHLALCPDCALESRWARDEAIVGRAATARPARTTRSSPLANPLWGWAVAAVAALALVVLIPRSAAPQPRIGIVTPVLVTETFRGAEPGSATVIDRTARQNPIFVVDLPFDAYPLRVSITDAAGTAVYTENGVAEDSMLNGYLQLESVSSLPVGDYVVRIVSETSGELPSEFRIRIVAP